MTARPARHRFKRTWPSALVLAAAACLATGIAQAAPKSKSKLKDMKIPETSRFIDTIGVQVPATDQADINARFTDGPQRVPGKAPVLNDGVGPWLRNMRADINEFTEYYTDHTKNPAPPRGQLPIFVVGSDDINCLVVREDYDQAGKSANTNTLGFLDTGNTAPSSSAVTGGPSTGADKPAHIELLCTNAAMEQIGGEHFGQRDSEGDSEMAFIIGHELSHILLGHYKLQEAQVKRQKELATMFRVGAVMLTLVNSKYSNGSITTSPQASKDLTKLLLVTYVVDEFNTAVMGPKWQREQERQADILSVDMMKGVNERAARPIWQPAAALAYLDKIEVAEKANKKKSTFGDELAGVVASGMLTGLNGNGEDKNIISSLATRVAVLAYLHWRDANLARLHDYADERKATIQDYMDSPVRFPKSVAMADDDEPAAAAITSAAPATPGLLPFPDRTKLYGQDLWSGDTYKNAARPQVAADALIDELQKSGCDTLSPGSQAFLAEEVKTGPQSQIENYALGAYMVCKGMQEDALPYFRAAVAGPQHRVPYYVTLIQTLQLLKHYEETLPVLDEAVANTQPANQYTALRIISLKGLNRTEEAEKMAAECKATEDPGVGTACMNAVGKTYEGEPLPAPAPAGSDGGDTASDSPFDFLRKLTGTPADKKSGS